MAEYLLGYGSNIDPERNIPRAAAALMRHGQLLACSRAWQTPTLWNDHTSHFVNGAWIFACKVAPQNMRLSIIRTIEAELGRVRGADPHLPRPIDIDLLLVDSGDYDDGDLCLPSTDVRDLAHVAIPAAELWPDWTHALLDHRPLHEHAQRFAAETATFTPCPRIDAALARLAPASQA